MLCANKRNKELSRALRVLVHQDLEERSTRTTWPGIDRESNQRKVSKQLEIIGKGLDILPVQNEHRGQECSAVLDTEQSQALASRILEGLQNHSKAPFHKGLYVMGRDMGAVVEVTQAMVEELEQQCPF